MSKFTKQEMAQAVLQALMALKEDGPECGEVGICTNVANMLDDEYDSFQLSRYWQDSRDIAFETRDTAKRYGVSHATISRLMHSVSYKRTQTSFPVIPDHNQNL